MKVQGVLRPKNDWVIPAYALDMLWVTTPKGVASELHLDGSFMLDPVQEAVSQIQLRWGNPTGSLLTFWEAYDAEYSLSLQWDGHVVLGGFIERTHILDHDDLPLMIVEMVGGAYPIGFKMLPTMEMLQQGNFSRDNDFDPTHENQWYSLLLPLESPLSDFVHHALVNGSAIDCYAHFADDESRWHQLMGMPLVLDKLTLLSTGI
jgi:hypothetical protein